MRKVINFISDFTCGFKLEYWENGTSLYDCIKYGFKLAIRGIKE